MNLYDTVNIDNFNFEEEDTCPKLVTLIDQATYLTSLSIQNQTGSIVVYVEITYASTGEEGEAIAGSISVKNLDDQTEICSSATDRTTEITVTQEVPTTDL